MELLKGIDWMIGMIPTVWPMRLPELMGLDRSFGATIPLALSITALLRIRKSKSMKIVGERLVIGGTTLAQLLFVRLLVSIVFLIAGGGGWLGVAGLAGVITSIPDALSYNSLVGKHRKGLAILTILAPVPPIFGTPVYLASITLSSTKNDVSTKSGIEIGRVRNVIAQTVLELRDRSEEVKQVKREWVILPAGDYPVYWSPEGQNGELNPHMIISGKSGGGKSTFMYYLIIHLLERGHGVTVVDMTGQYHAFARWLQAALKSPPKTNVEGLRCELERVLGRPLFRRASPDGCIKVYSVVSRGIDILKPVAGEPDVVIAEDLSYALSIVDRSMLGANQHYYLQKAVVTECWRARTEGRTPRLKSVGSCLEDILRREFRTPDGRIVERETYSAVMSLLRRIRLLSLYVESNGVPVSVDELEAARNETGWGELKIVDISSIHDEDVKAIVTELLLRKITVYLKMTAERRSGLNQKWFIVVDEAWRILQGKDVGSQYRSVLEWLFRIARNYSVGIIALTQLASDLGKHATNAETKIFMNIADVEDVEDLVSYTGVDILREISSQLPIHSALMITRSAIDDFVKASSYRGSAKLWLITEMKRLYIDRSDWLKAQELVGRTRKAELERLKAASRSLGVDLEGHRALSCEMVEATVRDRSDAASPTPLDELVKKLGKGVKPELVVAASLLALKGWIVTEKRRGSIILVTDLVPASIKDRLTRLGAIGSNGYTMSFLRLIDTLRNDSSYLAKEVVARTCPICLAYPVEHPHSCSVVEAEGYG